MKRSKTSGRVDDTPEAFQKRYKGFEEENADVLNYFQERGKLHKVRRSSKRVMLIPNIWKVNCDRDLILVYKEGVFPLVSVMLGCSIPSIETD